MDNIETREQAIRFVLGVLRHPLACMPISTRTQALTLCQTFNITGQDLIEFSVKRAREA